jgi:hypothetical protein
MVAVVKKKPVYENQYRGYLQASYLEGIQKTLTIPKN